MKFIIVNEHKKCDSEGVKSDQLRLESVAEKEIDLSKQLDSTTLDVDITYNT